MSKTYANRKTLVFTGQMTAEVKEVLRGNMVLVTNVPANMTRFYQPLDLTANGSAKQFIASKFDDWYADQIATELESVKSLEKTILNCAF